MRLWVVVNAMSACRILDALDNYLAQPLYQHIVH